MQIMGLNDAQKKVLLDFLDYEVKMGLIVNKGSEKPIICPYTKEPVRFKDASIMPGSTIVFNTNEVTLAEYFTDYPVQVQRGEDICQKTQDSM